MRPAVRQIWVLFLIFISFASCNKQEKKSLYHLLNEIVAATGRNFDQQLNGIHKQERYVRFRILSSSEILKTVDKFLATKPPLSIEAQKAVENYRATLTDERNLFESLLAERRYELTAEEKKQDLELRSRQSKNLEIIAKFVDN